MRTDRPTFTSSLSLSSPSRFINFPSPELVQQLLFMAVGWLALLVKVSWVPVSAHWLATLPKVFVIDWVSPDKFCSSTRITTLVALFSARRVLVIWCGWVWMVSVLQAGLQHGHHSNPAAPNYQHTTNREQNDRCGNSTAQSQAPDEGYIDVRNMLST